MPPRTPPANITQTVDEAGQETRGYGKLGELVRSTRTVGPLQPGDTARTYETRFTFDSFGRGQGEFPPHSNHDYDYQYTGNGPHQAVRIGDLKLTYDASGNTSVQWPVLHHEGRPPRRTSSTNGIGAPMSLPLGRSDLGGVPVLC